VATFGSGSITLQPSVQNAPIFGATVTNYGLTGLTGIITVNDGTVRNSPGSLTPVSGPAGSNQDNNNQDNNNQGEKTYTVTFSANGGNGTAPAAMTVTTGKSITLPGKGSLTKGDSIFEGWSDGYSTRTAGTSYTPTGSVTLSAAWSTVAPPNVVGTWICDQDSTFKIVFDSNWKGTWYDPAPEPFTYTISGNTITVSKVDVAQTATISGNTIYWEYNMTFTKQGSNSGKTYTVTFSANGGNGTAPSSQTVTAGQSITLPSGNGLSRSGYAFGGWNTNAAGTGTSYAAGSSYTVNADAALYAKWSTVVPPPPTNNVVGTWICDQDSTYFMFFNSNGTGTHYGYFGAEPINYTVSGNTITVTKVDGADIATISGNTIYLANMTFTKHGNDNRTIYTVTFSANGATGLTPYSRTVIAGKSITLPSGIDLSITGYTFGG
jgi:hypothetical protein